MNITISDRKLSDGSRVYNVWLDKMDLYADTEKDATQLASKLKEAIEAHTSDNVQVAYT